MAGTITHYWNGTMLVVTSDSGTSSADLSGPTGPRGPQGKPGVVYDTNGDLVIGGVVTQDKFDALEARVDILEANSGGGSGESVDLSNYYTIGQTNNAITATVTEFLKDYSTTEQMNAAIAQAQLGGSGGTVDLSSYATKTYVDEAIANISGGDMTNYYTKSEIDALFAAITDSEEVSY